MGTELTTLSFSVHVKLFYRIVSKNATIRLHTYPIMSCGDADLVLFLTDITLCALYVLCVTSGGFRYSFI